MDRQQGYRERSAAAREALTPPRAREWERDAAGDAAMAVVLVGDTIMAEAKKNPVQPAAFPWMPSTHVFGQSTHDVGRVVVDELIRCGWRPPSMVPKPDAPRPAPDLSWVTTEPAESSAGWGYVLGACAVLVALFGIAVFGVWVVTR